MRRRGAGDITSGLVHACASLLCIISCTFGMRPRHKRTGLICDNLNGTAYSFSTRSKCSYRKLLAYTLSTNSRRYRHLIKLECMKFRDFACDYCVEADNKEIMINHLNHTEYTSFNLAQSQVVITIIR